MEAKKLGIALIALAPVLAGAQNTEDAVAEFETLLRETYALMQYNALLERQIAIQEDDIVLLQADMDVIPDLERQLPPMLINMVDGLEAFVELDIPFLVDERQNRINDLYALIENPQVNEITQLRRVLEAWGVEREYGTVYQYDSGQVNIDEAERNVDFLILGRIGLIFQTTDDDLITGAWDHANREWVILGSEYRNQVRQAIQMSRNQVAPDLVLLPTLPPEL